MAVVRVRVRGVVMLCGLIVALTLHTHTTHTLNVPPPSIQYALFVVMLCGLIVTLGLSALTLTMRQLYDPDFRLNSRYGMDGGRIVVQP